MPLYATEHIPIPTRDLLSWCFDNRDTYDQHKAIYIDCVNPKRTISASQAWVLIRRLIAGLRAKGFQKGDCVCIHSFNDLYYPILVQGIIGAGGVFVGTNPAYTNFELNHALKTSKAKFVVSGPDILEAIEKAAVERGIPRDNIYLLHSTDEEPAEAKYPSWKTLLIHGSEEWIKFSDELTAKNTNAFLLFSSGTTGLPKAAQISHYNLIAQHTLLYQNPSHRYPWHVSRVTPLPFFHAAVAPFTHISTLHSGFTNHIMRRFSLHPFLTHTRSFHTTEMILVPPMVSAIVNLSLTKPDLVRTSLSSIRRVHTSAAPLDATLQSKLQSLLPTNPKAYITQLWAMSETTCVSSLFYPSQRDTSPSGTSVGKFMPNIDVKLVDPDTSLELPSIYDTPGELCVRGPNVIRGYLDNADANARDWDAEGFFHTGDILLCEGKSGLWFVVDRKKEMIKVRGFQVSPSEVEGVVAEMEGVRDVAVIGVRAGREGDGEVPRAYVVLREGWGEKVREKDVKGWVGERLAGYKRLDGGVRFVNEIPKSATGKILKRVLRERAVKEKEAKL